MLMSNPRQLLKEIADLDQFAKDHPGTNAGAKALFQEGFQFQSNLAITGVEPRGSDPTERLLRVAAIVKELESGKFPRSEWVEKAPELIEFVKKAFGATEIFRTTGSAGGMHAEVRIGESMLMIGGGPGIKESPTAIHLYLPDVDTVYERALQAGATSLFAPADQEYGERSGAVQDPTGNRWYIATTFETTEWPKELRTVTLYFHPIGAPGLIEFMKNAFGAEELMRHQPERILSPALQEADSGRAARHVSPLCLLFAGFYCDGPLIGLRCHVGSPFHTVLRLEWNTSAALRRQSLEPSHRD